MSSCISEAKLFAVHIDLNVKDSLLQRSLDILPSTERHRIQRYVRREDRVRSLIGLLLIHQFIYNEKPREIMRDFYGRPHVTGMAAGDFRSSPKCGVNSSLGSFSVMSPKLAHF